MRRIRLGVLGGREAEAIVESGSEAQGNLAGETVTGGSMGGRQARESNVHVSVKHTATHLRHDVGHVWDASIVSVERQEKRGISWALEALTVAVRILRRAVPLGYEDWYCYCAPKVVVVLCASLQVKCERLPDFNKKWNTRWLTSDSPSYPAQDSISSTSSYRRLGSSVDGFRLVFAPIVGGTLHRRRPVPPRSYRKSIAAAGHSPAAEVVVVGEFRVGRAVFDTRILCLCALTALRRVVSCR